MAKKSAKSKGFRRAAGKKPYLTKKDIIILCILLAAVIVGAILLFTYDDGALKVKDGSIVDPGENWLIVNGSASGGRRYYKLAEVGDIEGYTMSAEPVTGDDNLKVFKYTPEDDNSPVNSITISCVAADPERAASYYQSLFKALDPSEVIRETVDSAECSHFSYTSSFYAKDPDSDEAEASTEAVEPVEEAEQTDENDREPNHFEQAMHAYYSAPHKGSVGIAVQATADSEQDYLSDEAMLEVVAKAYAAITLEAE